MYRLKVKFHRGWKLSLGSYPTQEAAQARADELIGLGQKRNKIKVVPETELFN